MKKRDFIKSSLLAGAALMQLPLTSFTSREVPPKSKLKHWIWINPDKKDSEEELLKRYTHYYKSGIRGIFFEADSEKHFRTAKKCKLEAHRWMWTLNRGEQELLKSHPEWYAVNRKGESCADKPPYVNYYRWLCPSRDEVHAYLEKEVKSILSKEYVDGVHLDYVRYCDVILPVNLWPSYNIEQTRELPEYDYCYCDVCRIRYKEKTHHVLDELQYPDQSPSWRQFRYDNVTRLVNRLSDVASNYKKPITAAVFPTPEIARRIVRQDWTNWNLSGICPMIYHGFYKENVQWIGDAVAEGVRLLHGKSPLYAGLYLPDFKNNDELKQGMKYALQNGAAGISIFGNATDEVLHTLKEISTKN